MSDPVLLKIMREREREALNQAKKLQEKGAKKVVVIFHIGFDLDNHQQEFPGLQIRRVSMQPDTPLVTKAP